MNTIYVPYWRQQVFRPEINPAATLLSHAILPAIQSFFCEPAVGEAWTFRGAGIFLVLLAGGHFDGLS